MAWTKEQMQCIEPKNGIHNILVSAGAGAGKTATLVEKIIRGITTDEHSMGINEILCVTFTREAAREMKERISLALEKMLREHPNNIWLKRQMALTETAAIMTIDSFCLRLVKDHISDTDIDPAFRIADQAELSVLWEKAMDEFLEMQYEAESPEFLSFADAYSSGKHDQGIRDSIKSVYDMAQSNPFPEKWLENCKNVFQCKNINDTEWIQFLIRDIHMQAESIYNNLTAASAICSEPGGPYMLDQMIETDKEQVLRLLEAKDYDTISSILSAISFARLSSKKDITVLPAKKERVISIRNAGKKVLQDMQKKYVLKDKNAVEEIKPHMLTLIDLTESFIGYFSQKKKEKTIMDFGDIEHTALSLLFNDDGYSPLADEVAKGFKQIYVDEYQDVNMLQETIIQSVSGSCFGKPNVFMVGDVKQSIYKFRLARPELFLEKYASYSEDEMSDNQKVELFLNFRSRKEVLETINFFFGQLMTPALGNIKYDGKAALKNGAKYPLGVDAKKTKLYLMDTTDSDTEELKSRQKEAMLIADIIKDTVGKEAVYDKNTGAYRPASYKDIVVLTRSFSGWAEDVLTILDEEGIPSYADKSEGFFDTVEVQAVLSMLQIADNPMQDIPLSSAMMRIWDFSAMDMCEIAELFKQEADINGGLYTAVEYYRDNGNDKELRKRINLFLTFLKKITVECRDYSITEILNIIYKETGYYAKCTSLPNGEIKKANLEMLLNEADKFSAMESSGSGIFNFVKYVDTLKKYEKEYGASTYADKDATRITTIHKSKGLEFPIVILAGIGKRFNQQDTRKSILVHQDLGLVSDFIDTNNKIKKLTLPKRAVARKIQIETLEEELRILYVAMTRAKERLIMIGSGKDILSKMQKYAGMNYNTPELPYLELTQATSFMDWIFMALSRNKIYEPFAELAGIEMDTTNPVYHMDANVEIKMVDINDLIANHEKDEKEERILKSDVEQILFEKVYNGSNRLYPYKNVAELKPKALPEDLAKGKKKSVAKKRKVNKTELLPKFMQKKQTTSADKGTIYHKILQMIDFAKCDTKEGIDREIQRLIDGNVVTNEEIKKIRISLLGKFFESDLGKTMISVEKSENKIKKETYYMEAVPAKLVDPEIDDDTTVIMQGVIDAYFKTEDGYILIDYKSDRVPSGREESAAKKHCSQIERYRKVMEKAGFVVKKAYIVFLQTGKAVEI